MQPGQPKGGFFGKKAVQKLLDYPECVGLRFFFGAKRDGERVVVGLCVDKFGTDLFYGPGIDLSGSADVTLSIFDLLGRRVRMLVNMNQPAGEFSVTWNGRNDIGRQVASGVYVYSLSAGEFKQTRKMLLLR